MNFLKNTRFSCSEGKTRFLQNQMVGFSGYVHLSNPVVDGDRYIFQFSSEIQYLLRKSENKIAKYDEISGISIKIAKFMVIFMKFSNYLRFQWGILGRILHFIKIDFLLGIVCIIRSVLLYLIENLSTARRTIEFQFQGTNLQIFTAIFVHT